MAEKRKRKTVFNRLTENKGRYVYLIVAYQSDGRSHNTAGFTTKLKAERFRKICQTDFKEMFNEYDERVTKGLGVTRTRTKSRVDARLDWTYPTIVEYALESVPVFTYQTNLTLVSRGIGYELRRDWDKIRLKSEYKKKKQEKENET